MSNNKILLITYSYSPVNSPHAYHWDSIVNHWLEKDYKIDVLTSWKPGLKLEENHENLNVYRIKDIRYTLKNLILSSRNTVINSNSSKVNDEMIDKKKWEMKKYLSKIIKKIHDYSWKKIYWPDYAVLWYFIARIKARKLFEMNNYSNLITESHPYTDHLIGLYLSRKFKFNWLVDMGDPFYFLNDPSPNNNFFYNRLNYYIEQKIIDKSNQVRVINNYTRNKYLNSFSINKNKLNVIPPLISLPDKKGKSFEFSSDKIKLVYIGSLYKDKRNPKFLLYLFNEFLIEKFKNNIELHFFGNINECLKDFEEYNSLVGKNIFLHGSIDRNKVPAIMANSDILINIGNTNQFQLPSKLVEYISSGSPIINIIKVKDDTSLDILDEYPSVFNIIEDENALNNKLIMDLIKFVKCSNSVNDKTIKNLIKRYEVENIAGKYENTLKLNYKLRGEGTSHE